MLDQKLPCDVKLVLFPRERKVGSDAFDRLDTFGRLSEMLSDLREPAQGLLVFGALDNAVTLRCHLFTNFACRDGILYFPFYHPRRSGCTVAAYELASGRELWRQDLQGSSVERTAMRNTVGISVSEQDVILRGREGQTAYIEVFDRRSGERLGHRIF